MSERDAIGQVMLFSAEVRVITEAYTLLRELVYSAGEQAKVPAQFCAQ